MAENLCKLDEYIQKRLEDLGYFSDDSTSYYGKDANSARVQELVNLGQYMNNKGDYMTKNKEDLEVEAELSRFHYQLGKTMGCLDVLLDRLYKYTQEHQLDKQTHEKYRREYMAHKFLRMQILDGLNNRRLSTKLGWKGENEDD